MPDALQHIAHDDQHGHRRDNRGADLQIQHRVGDDLLVTGAGDGPHRRVAEAEHEEHYKDPPDKIDAQRRDHAFHDAAAAACAQVLAAVGRHGNAQCAAGDKEQLGKAAGGDLRGNVGAAQRIDAALQHHTADVVDGAHQPHAEPGPEHVASKIFAVGKGGAVKMQAGITADDIPPAQHRTDALCRHGGSRRTADAKVQRAHKGDIQPDVERRAAQQKVQRRQAVANGPQQGSLHIIGHRQRNAE